MVELNTREVRENYFRRSNDGIVTTMMRTRPPKCERLNTATHLAKSKNTFLKRKQKKLDISVRKLDVWIIDKTSSVATTYSIKLVN